MFFAISSSPNIASLVSLQANWPILDFPVSLVDISITMSTSFNSCVDIGVDVGVAEVGRGVDGVAGGALTGVGVGQLKDRLDMGWFSAWPVNDDNIASTWTKQSIRKEIVPSNSVTNQRSMATSIDDEAATAGWNTKHDPPCACIQLKRGGVWG